MLDLDHIAITVKDLDESIAFYKMFGYELLEKSFAGMFSTIISKSWMFSGFFPIRISRIAPPTI